MHNAAYAIDDVWGSSMDLTGDASQKESQSNTVFDKSNTTVIPVPADTQTAAEQTTKPDTTASSAVPQNQKTIKEIEFYGLNSLPKDEILSQMKMKEGEPYSREDMQNDLKAIYDTGYFSEKMKAIPTDNPDGTINVSIKEGVIDKIMIEGNEKTKDYIIARNILTEPGMVYNENMIKEDLVRLYATQAFKDVTREIEPSETTPDAYDITIKIKEQRTASISVGGGLDTVTGLFGSMGIAENNFRGRAERISLTGLAGTGVIMNDNSVKDHMNIQAELSYFKPYFFNSDTSLNTRLFFRDFGSYQVPMAIERRYGLEFTVAHKLKFNKHATGTFSLGAENIDVKEGDFNRIAILYREYNVPLSERAKQLDGGLFLTLSPALLYDTRDSATVTRHGTMASVRFDESLGLDGFDKTNGRLTGMIKQYIPIAKKSSLAFTVKGGGAIHGDIPEVMAYRLGGPYTIRGFKMSGVGTGNAFVMGSAEFATPIPFMDRTRIAFLNNLRFTVWMDAGKVFDGTVSDTIYDRPMYAVSAGVGLKVFIPGMGPLSIDYGFPLTHSGKNGPDNGYFTFGVGDLVY